MLEKPPSLNYLIPIDELSIAFQGEINDDLKKCLNEYLYWDRIKYLNKESSKDLWNSIKFYRKLRSNYIYFNNYRFSFLITDKMQQLLHLFDLHIGGNLTSNTGIAESDRTKFMINSIMEEAISSSQIEGAATTRKKAKEMIRQEKKPKNKSEQMIMNNFITMKHIVQHKEDKLTPQLILEVHKLISKNTLDENKDEGKFRSANDVYVVDHVNSEIVHTPPSYKEIEPLIASLCDFFNKDNEPFVHPIIKGCIIHFMIGWIHPFVDGNGRTARALFYWYMLQKGYWLVEFLSISRIIQNTKTQYEKAFLYTENDDNDVGYFIHYHLKTMDKALIDLKKYINKKQQEISQAADFMKIDGVNERMAQIIKIIYDDSDRILNTKEIKNRFGVSDFTARADLKALTALGFLQEIAVTKQKKNYIKSNYFDSKINTLDIHL